ncbi:Uncharacterized protein GBIM_08768 [Gryllus bimaculatus]|nr:Uncharacterized protein GBIM_08768 [Gryllus bimaculatus]
MQVLKNVVEVERGNEFMDSLAAKGAMCKIEKHIFSIRKLGTLLPDAACIAPHPELCTRAHGPLSSRVRSPTKAGGSKLEMLSNVKGQMSSWLSTGITGIQGLRRNEETVPDPVGLPPVGDPAPPPAAAGATAMGGGSGGVGGLAPADGQMGVESPASEKSVKGSPVEQKEDDDSRIFFVLYDEVHHCSWGTDCTPGGSWNRPLRYFWERKRVLKDGGERCHATGGADSDVAASEPGTPGEDKDGAHALGGVSTKALQGAKSIGSFLFSAVNKAGKTVTEATTKIKKTVEENGGGGRGTYVGLKAAEHGRLAAAARTSPLAGRKAARARAKPSPLRGGGGGGGAALSLSKGADCRVVGGPAGGRSFKPRHIIAPCAFSEIAAL